MPLLTVQNKQSIIFDMDGCLVDTESVYVQAWYDVFRNAAIDIELDTIHSWTGLSWADIRRDIARRVPETFDVDDLRAKREEIFYEMLRTDRVSLKPYAVEILNKCKDKGYVVGLGTATYHDKALEILEHFNLTHFFDYMVFGDTVENTKPAPDIFIECVRQSGIDAQYTLIFEDSLNGLRAANAAGVDVVFIPDFRYYGLDEAHYIACVPTFNEISF